MANIGINGFGRIGRLAFRRLWDQKVKVVAINDLTDPKTLANLLKYDSAHGKFLADKIQYNSEFIMIGDQKIRIFSFKNPAEIPWKEVGADLIIESTGFFRTKEKAALHLKAGAKKVVISAPAGKDVKTIVYDVNHKIINKNDQIISAASCTTNCLAPVINVLDNNFGVVKGYMTTIHSATNDQRLLDLPHLDLRRGRSVFGNIIPTKTGAAAAVGLVLPQLNGKLDGGALRIPTITGSIVDLSVELKKDVTAKEINEVFKKSASDTLAYNEDPIVLKDIVGETHGSIFDATLTKVISIPNQKQLVKVFSWYDNEYSYVCQLIRTVLYFLNLK